MYVYSSSLSVSISQVIKMLVVVVVLFAICWLPLHVFILLLDFQPQLLIIPGAERIFVVVYYCVHWLAMSNSFMNPIIYGFLNDSFKVTLNIRCKPQVA